MKRLLPLLLILWSIACTTEDELQLTESDYLIFGHFYGECIGEGCVETFKLTKTQLFEDTKDVYYATENFDFIELDQNLFEATKDLIDFFPAVLLESEQDVYGCPDCGDWGGLFIQYSEKGKVNSWRIDQMKTNVPEDLHIFIDKVNAKISIINE